MRPQVYIRPLFQTPAPNAYRAEDVIVHKPTIFRKTFGEKHSVFAGAMLNRVTSQCRMVSLIQFTPTFDYVVVRPLSAVEYTSVASVWSD